MVAKATAEGISVSPTIVIETTQLIRQAYHALKGVNHLLVHSEECSTIEATDLAALLLPIQERLYGALDELDAVCRGSAHE